MSRKGRFGLALLVVAGLAAGLALFFYEPKERFYQGKRAEEWIAGLNRPFEESLAQPWRDLGPDAVPLLIQAVGTGVGFKDRAYAMVWPRLPARFKKRMGPPVDMFRARANAATILGKLGPEAASAAPALSRALRDPNPNVRVAAAQTLTLLVPEASKDKQRMLPDFLRAMNDTNTLVREHAATFLADYREQSRKVAPALVKALEDPAMEVRLRAFSGLNRMDFSKVNPRQVAPMLIRCLHHKEATVRACAAAKLGVMGKEPATVVPALTQLLDDREAVVRFTAAVALGKFGPAARSAVPALVKALEAPEPVVKAAATSALAQIDPVRGHAPAPVVRE